MKVTFDNRMFKKDMKNIVDYSIGFLDGIKKGKTEFLNIIGLETIELMKEYIDSSARVNPAILHHVYE